VEIEHIAALARLKLSDSEKDLFSRQISNIISYIEKLNELDTSSVEPTAHVFPIHNVFREDVATPSLSRDKALQNSPEKDDSFYIVPKIIE
jgi:aspartyl-tRNA(Asn)/glutamyl-tRNA(Gln) amidotransferase subunit C